MHPILKIIYMLPFKTRRRIFEGWLRAIGMSRHEQHWISNLMSKAEYTK